MSKRMLALGAALIVLQVWALQILGQPWICECGFIKAWEGVVLSSGNSQHLTDWYTFSHVIHGVVFYFALTYFFPHLSWSARLAIAVGAEVVWELFENTPLVIDHYRQQALAQGYTGDSILNSVSDTLAMVLGFIAALRFPAWLVISAALLVEAFTLYMIRDSLALNIVGFIAPDLLSGWQSQ